MKIFFTEHDFYSEVGILFKDFQHDLSFSIVIRNISSVGEFQRWWVLKSKLFGQELTCHQGKIFKKFLRVMTVCQKLGVILESKVVQKLSLEKKRF